MLPSISFPNNCVKLLSIQNFHWFFKLFMCGITFTFHFPRKTIVKVLFVQISFPIFEFYICRIDAFHYPKQLREGIFCPSLASFSCFVLFICIIICFSLQNNRVKYSSFKHFFQYLIFSAEEFIFFTFKFSTKQ